MAQTRLIKKNGRTGGTRENEQTPLTEFAQWDIKTINTLKRYVAALESTPSSKALISTMIEFSQMYKPVSKGIFSTNFWTDYDGINEYLHGKRLQTYLHKKDLLKTVNGTEGKTLVLTTRAHKIYYEQYPLAKLRKQKWDGTWTAVMYDFPINLKTERDYLRRKLKHLGFGCLQQSVLVSPLPLEKALQELIEGERMENHTVVLTAQRILGFTNREIAATAWNLQEINNIYEKLLQVLPKIKRRGKSKLLGEWRTYFLATNFEDPYLPHELLPENWLGEKCKKEFTGFGLSSLLKIIFGG